MERKEYFLKYREMFIQEYHVNRNKIIENILHYLEKLPSSYLKEVVKIIYFDNDSFHHQIISGNFNLDLRQLHIETVLTLWVYFQEINKTPNLTAEMIKNELQI